jgi:outer membrane protein OmpA-like peptidoglycan-associated protein
MRPLDPSGDEDRDGIRNEIDKAPTIPEDKDGVQDEDGVPDPETADAKAFAAAGGPGKKFSDIDKDGIADAYDLCFEGAEDRDGFEDDDGCPDLDNDGDGTPDEKDPCPNVPGTWCSREKSAHAPSAAPTQDDGGGGSKGSLNIEDEVFFPAKSAKLDMRRSRAALNNVLSELMAEPNLRIEIRGHAEPTGNSDAEKKLSQLRADAIRAELVKLGISGNRLVANGVGADIKRVEFVILP